MYIYIYINISVHNIKAPFHSRSAPYARAIGLPGNGDKGPF